MRTMVMWSCAALVSVVLACACGAPRDGGQTGSELACVTDTDCLDALGDGHYCDQTDHCAPVPDGLEPWSTRQVCDQLLECADFQSPSQLGELLPIYGVNGSCFQQQGDAPCREACVAGLSSWYQSGRGHPCNFCDTATSCPSVESSRHGVCRAASRDCVQCISDDDCIDNGLADIGRVYCDRNQCNACLVDEHCPAPECEEQVVRCVDGSPKLCRVEWPNSCAE